MIKKKTKIPPFDVIFFMFVREGVCLALSQGSSWKLCLLITFWQLVCDLKDFPSCALASLHGGGRSRAANTLGGVPRSAERKMSLKIHPPHHYDPQPPPLFFCGFRVVRETYRRLRIERSWQNSFSFHLAAAACERNKALRPLLGVIAAASRGIRLILRLRSRHCTQQLAHASSSALPLNPVAG